MSVCALSLPSAVALLSLSLSSVLSASALVTEAANRGLTPPPDLTVSQWADEHRELSSSVSSEPGRWRTERVPYMRQIMDVLSPNSAARAIAFMKGSQVAGTEASLNWVGHSVYFGLGSMLIVLPSLETAKEWSNQRLSQLTDDTPCLHGKILDKRRRDSGNTSFGKKFPGGYIKIAWSSSAKKLRSTPAGLLLADEVDGFEGDTQGEGDPIALLKRRFTNYPLGKLFMISTPKAKGSSRIQREFAAGDQRYFFLPCPHCGHFQRLAFDNLKFEKGLPRTAAYECVACQERIPERFKTQMLARGLWVATRDVPEIVDAGFAAADLAKLAPVLAAMDEEENVSFHLSALYSPLGWYSWAQVATDWEQAQGKPDLLKVFVNTVLGECWEERGESPDDEMIWRRREEYEIGVVPMRGLFLTAFVDVQDEELFAEVKAWGRGKENWSVAYIKIRCQTKDGDAIKTSSPEPWKVLSEILANDWPHESGETMPIMVMGIDSGFRAQTVYDFASKHPQPAHNDATGSRIVAQRTVVVTKGDENDLKLIANVSKSDAARKRGGLRIWHIGTGRAKQEFYDALRLAPPENEGEPQPGRCHYPYPEREFYRQVCSESKVVRSGGKVQWVKDPAVRNEPVDTHVGNRAMASLCGIDGHITEDEWLDLESRYSARAVPTQEEETPAEQPSDSGSWLGDRRSWF